MSFKKNIGPNLKKFQKSFMTIRRRQTNFNIHSDICKVNAEYVHR